MAVEVPERQINWVVAGELHGIAVMPWHQLVFPLQCGGQTVFDRVGELALVENIETVAGQFATDGKLRGAGFSRWPDGTQ